MADESNKSCNLGVAYSMKRRKKYAKGGQVEGSVTNDRQESIDDEQMLHTSPDSQPAELSGSDFNKGSGSEGNQPKDDLHGGSLNEDIVEAIMAKRKFAAGGMVENAGEVDDQFIAKDRFSDHGQEANLKEDYESDIDDESKDQMLVSQIMKKT